MLKPGFGDAATGGSGIFATAMLWSGQRVADEDYSDSWIIKIGPNKPGRWSGAFFREQQRQAIVKKLENLK